MHDEWKVKEARRAKWRLAYQRQRYHPDNDRICCALSLAPCPCCGNITVLAQVQSVRWLRGSKRWKREYRATCSKCAASGGWPITGLSVDKIVANIQQQMKAAVAKALME